MILLNVDQHSDQDNKDLLRSTQLVFSPIGDTTNVDHCWSVKVDQDDERSMLIDPNDGDRGP